MAVSTKNRLLMVWRSLWIQGALSFTGMQTVGFVHALEPALDEDEKRKEKLLAHLDFFNAHPFLAPLALGVVASRESWAIEADPEAAAERKLVMGPLGGMGDSLFWGGLKPLAAVAAVLLALEGALWSPWLMVGVFGGAGLITRWYTLGMGLKNGKGAILKLQQYKPILWANRMKLLLAALLGWVVLRFAEGAALRLGVGVEILAPACLLSVLACAGASRRGVNPLGMVYAAFAVFLVITLLK